MKPNQLNRGFTLVELMVVILLIAILVSLVVSVSRNITTRGSVETTRLYMASILDSLEAYRQNDKNDSYPPEPIRANITPAPANFQPDDWEAFNRDGWLVRFLSQNPASKTRLPKEAKAFADFGQAGNFNCKLTGKNYFDRDDYFGAGVAAKDYAYPDNGKVLVDGFGKFMDYRRSGGAGGSPLLTSAGADGKFGTDDDIRSDKR